MCGIIYGFMLLQTTKHNNIMVFVSSRTKLINNIIYTSVKYCKPDLTKSLLKVR